MIDFNHEKITEQEKQDFLTQQIDPEYKKKRKEFGYIPFSGAWIITYKMLQMLNKAALENEGIFDFYQEDLELFDPSMTCVLFEGDRIKEGEWDRFYECWSKRDYVRCRVIFPSQGIITDIHEDKYAVFRLALDPENEELFKNKISKYPNTWNIDGSWNEEAGGSGIIEFDPELIDSLLILNEGVQEYGGRLNEASFELYDRGLANDICKRIDTPLWEARNFFDRNVAEKIKSNKENKEKKANRRNQRRNRSKRDIKKSIKKGFSL